MNLKKKVLAAVLAGGVLFSTGDVLADNASDSLMKFKEAYLAEVTDNRNFRVNADLFSPSYRAELNGNSFILRDATMRMSGQINWEFTNPSDNQVTNENIPYYIEQNGNTMTMYVQRNGSWSRFTLPAIPVGVANAIKTTDVTTLQQNMEAVKSVDILKDDDNQRIMNVTLDGKKLAELVQNYNSDSSDKDFLAHIVDALQNTDVTCAWTVNKKDWSTVTANFDLTKLLQAYGKDYLDDAAKGEIVLSQSDRAFYEVIGYYSELHFVATSYKDPSGQQIAQPQGASSARNNANVFADLVQKISQTKR